MKKTVIFFSVILLLGQIGFSEDNETAWERFKTSATKEASVMPEIMASWRGKSLNELISRWGYPDREKVIAGRHLYYWQNGEHNTITTAYGYITELYCTRVIEVDNNDIIVGYQWEGTQCPVVHMQTAYKQWVHPDKSYYKLKQDKKNFKKQQRLENKRERS
jgi:hypothetical protein